MSCRFFPDYSSPIGLKIEAAEGFRLLEHALPFRVARYRPGRDVLIGFDFCNVREMTDALALDFYVSFLFL